MKKETKHKTVNKVFLSFLFILFITFMTLYISQATGYYEFEQSRKAVFTAEQIEKFEQDVKAGKEIDINNYLDNTNKNYQNNISRATLSISESISKYTKMGVEKIFSSIAKMIEE